MGTPLYKVRVSTARGTWCARPRDVAYGDTARRWTPSSEGCPPGNARSCPMTHTSTHTAINYEPYDDDSRLHQFDLYKQMRQHAPVYLTESGWWCISRYDDVREVLLSPEKF